MSYLDSEIFNVGKQYNLRISESKPQPVVSTEYYNNFSIRLVIDGELDNVVHFLYILQNPPYSFNVYEAHFNKSRRRLSTNLKVNLTLNKIMIP